MNAADHRSTGPYDGFRDEALVDATRNGEEQAFALLVRRYIRRAMAVALEFVDSRDDAEDIVQETFRRTVVALDRFDATKPFEPWFFTILRNTARNAARAGRSRRQEPLDAQHASPEPGPFEAAHRKEVLGRIRAAIERLPAMQRSCFRLCVVEGLTSGEAAAAMGLAESTVRVHVFQAKRTLRDRLGLWHDEVTEA